MTIFRCQILPTLAVLVVVCAQVFGVQRGYACTHGSAVVETGVEHCHHGEDDDHEEDIPCKETAPKDCDGKGSKEHHTPLSVEMQAPPANGAAVTIPAFVAMLVAELVFQDWVLIQELAEYERLQMPPDTGEDNLSAAIQVARCLVILI